VGVERSLEIGVWNLDVEDFTCGMQPRCVGGLG
jgi:hypothetical protein